MPTDSGEKPRRVTLTEAGPVRSLVRHQPPTPGRTPPEGGTDERIRPADRACVRPTGPALPTGRGDLSYAVVRALRGRPHSGTPLPGRETADEAQPYGEDLHLALYVCYELHYRGFCGVDPGWEWDSGLLGLRAEMERRFLAALRADTGRRTDIDQALHTIRANAATGPSPAQYLGNEGDLWHLREYTAQRSLYHLKDSDPHAWVIPRLWGRAKAAMVAVEYDEFGAGRPDDRRHSRLYALLMADLGLDATYGRYVEAAPAEMLASVNLMSLLGLHRALRGALVGHVAAVKATSSPLSRRLARALRRVGAGSAAVNFHTEHVAADAAHEQIVRHDVIGGLLEEEPWLAEDVAFGVDATRHLDARHGGQLLTAWRDGLSGLRKPL